MVSQSLHKFQISEVEPLLSKPLDVLFPKPHGTPYGLVTVKVYPLLAMFPNSHLSLNLFGFLCGIICPSFIWRLTKLTLLTRGLGWTGQVTAVTASVTPSIRPALFREETQVLPAVSELGYRLRCFPALHTVPGTH